MNHVKFLTELKRINSNMDVPPPPQPTRTFTGALSVMSIRGLSQADRIDAGHGHGDSTAPSPDPTNTSSPPRRAGRRGATVGIHHTSTAPDPYVEVWWNDALVGSTEVVYNTTEPAWRSRSEFRLTVGLEEVGNTLRLEVYDRDEPMKGER